MAIADERPLRADARRNRAAILKAARQVFARCGGDAQMDDVARRAKVGVGTLYRHFPTKEALLEALAHDHFDRVIAICREALEVEDPWEAFEQMLWRSASLFAGDRALAEVVVSAPSGMAKTAEQAEELRAIGDAVLRRGQEAGVIRPDARGEDIGVVMCGVGSAMHSDVPGSWERHLRIALDGFRTSPACPPMPEG
jgi:AcrR family transcriptional regulator